MEGWVSSHDENCVTNHTVTVLRGLLISTASLRLSQQSFYSSRYNSTHENHNYYFTTWVIARDPILSHSHRWVVLGAQLSWVIARARSLASGPYGFLLPSGVDLMGALLRSFRSKSLPCLPPVAPSNSPRRKTATQYLSQNPRKNND